MLPIYDSKELIQHATSKATEVRYRVNIPFIDSERFRIMIVDDDAFAAARGKLLARPPDLVTITPAGSDEAKAWIDENLEPYETMNRKLTHIFSAADKRRSYIEGLLAKHIETGNAMTNLRSRFPDQWENVVACIRNRESVLEARIS